MKETITEEELNLALFYAVAIIAGVYLLGIYLYINLLKIYYEFIN